MPEGAAWTGRAAAEGGARWDLSQHRRHRRAVLPGHRIDRRRLANVATHYGRTVRSGVAPAPPFLYAAAGRPVELALTLLGSDFGIQLEDLAKAAQHSGGVIETLRTVIQDRHEALDALDQHVRRAASEGSGARPPLPDGKPRTHQDREAISA